MRRGPDTNAREPISPTSLTNNLHTDDQFYSSHTHTQHRRWNQKLGGAWLLHALLCKQRAALSYCQELEQNRCRLSALKITEGKGSHFITFDRTGSWSRQLFTSEKSKELFAMDSLTQLRCEVPKFKLIQTFRAFYSPSLLD